MSFGELNTCLKCGEHVSPDKLFHRCNMKRSERLAAIRHWRQCEMLEQPFFSIQCGSTVMDTVSFGEVIDFLLECTQTTGAAKAVRECYQIAQSCENGYIAAKLIQKKFGLEI